MLDPPRRLRHARAGREDVGGDVNDRPGWLQRWRPVDEWLVRAGRLASCPEGPSVRRAALLAERLNRGRQGRGRL
eukprot:7444158-Alexandrium_andersonii.AAC.1